MAQRIPTIQGDHHTPLVLMDIPEQPTTTRGDTRMGATDPEQPGPHRVRQVDWITALRHIDNAPMGTPVLVARLHRAVATQINRGQYAYINPLIYEAWTANYDGETSEIWMRRRT